MTAGRCAARPAPPAGPAPRPGARGLAQPATARQGSTPPGGRAPRRDLTALLEDLPDWDDHSTPCRQIPWRRGALLYAWGSRSTLGALSRAAGPGPPGWSACSSGAAAPGLRRSVRRAGRHGRLPRRAAGPRARSRASACAGASGRSRPDSTSCAGTSATTAPSSGPPRPLQRAACPEYLATRPSAWSPAAAEDPAGPAQAGNGSPT